MKYTLNHAFEQGINVNKHQVTGMIVEGSKAAIYSMKMPVEKMYQKKKKKGRKRKKPVCV